MTSGVRGPSSLLPRRAPSRPLRARAGLALALLLGARAVPAQIAHPNQIVGTITITNRDPAVLGVLAAQPVGGLTVETTSLAPAPYSTSTATLSVSDPIRIPYSITVEGGPPGSGYSHEVRPRGSLAGSTRKYYFARFDSPPVQQEPAPDVRVDLSECAGVIHILFRDPAGLPSAIEAGDVNVTRIGTPVWGEVAASGPLAAGATEDFLVVRGDGTTNHVDVTLTTGTDEYVDKLQYQTSAELVVDCDAIVDLVVTVYPPGAAPLGRIIGNLDVVGEEERGTPDRTSLIAGGGPYGNRRYHDITTSPASGRFEFPNLFPSDAVSPPDGYTILGSTRFRTGRRFEEFIFPWLEDVVVPAGATVDVGDAHVIRPAFIAGDILLAGPPATAPAVRAPLAALLRLDEDTHEDTWESRVAAHGNDVVVPGSTRSALNAHGLGLFEGDADTAGETFAGNYELAVGGLFSEPTSWQMSTLKLEFEDRSTPTVPETYLSGGFAIGETRYPDLVLGPGDRATAPLAYCLSEVRVAFSSVGGDFSEPRLDGTGSFTGTDFLGNPADYSVWLGTTYGQMRGFSKTQGMVTAILPQGSYALVPTIRARDGSTVRLPRFLLDVGCRQTIEVTIQRQVSVDGPTCAVTGSPVHYTGSVTATEDIDHIEYTVNGGAPVVVCTPCGTDPTYAFDATLAEGPNDIEVSAYTVPLGVPFSVTMRTVVAPDTAPGDMGNVLRAVKRAPHVLIGWTPVAGAALTRVRRDVTKPFPAPVTIGDRNRPIAEALDPGALPPVPEPLYFYRVTGLTCAGAEGP